MSIITTSEAATLVGTSKRNVVAALTAIGIKPARGDLSAPGRRRSAWWESAQIEAVRTSIREHVRAAVSAKRSASMKAQYANNVRIASGNKTPPAAAGLASLAELHAKVDALTTAMNTLLLELSTRPRA